jgi:hypothetical protein
MRLQLRSIVAAVAMICGIAAGQNARAVDITFDFTSGVGGQLNFSKTASGYTLNFSNPSPFFVFGGTTDGLWIDSLVNQFQIALTGGPVTDALLFKNYEVGSVPGGGAQPFTLTGGTGTSTNNSLATIGVFNFNGQFSIAQGQTVNFSAPGTSALSTIKRMTFTIVPVPEPSTYALGAIATGVMAFVARRRKAKRA